MSWSRENMKILFIVPYVPDQIRARSYHFIKGLTELGHQVRVLTLWTDEWERTSLRQLSEFCDEVYPFRLKKSRSLINCLWALPTRLPLQAVYSWSPAVTHFISDHISNGAHHEEYDIIHVEHLRGARYGLYLRQLFADRGIGTPIIWDSVDCISSLFKQASRQSRSLFGRWVTRFEIPRTESFEVVLRDSFDQVMATSRVDADALQALHPAGDKGRRIEIITNGVDLEYFIPNSSVTRESKTLVMTGKMSYHANVTMAIHFSQRIFPHILRKDPEVQLWIVGKDPSHDVRKLAEHPNVHVVGTVPDLRPYLWQSSIAIVPLTYAVGVQFKVLEAMACATPVVMSSACSTGLGIEPGNDAMVAEGDAEFAQKVLSLLDDPAMRERIASAGRGYVERNHDWKQIAERLESIYDGI